MKHSKEKARVPVKGRRRLEFGTPKQQLPLLNKAVYMDIKNSRQANLMEEQLKKLGARVEKFLSVEVNYVISSSGPSKPDEKLSREENPQSPSFVPSPFNCVPSPTVQPEAKTVIVSRGKALAQIACAKNKASSVVTSAEKLGIKVVSAEAATKWLEKEIRKMKRGVESNIKENKSKKTEGKLKEGKAKSKVLMGSFIKFEDSSRHYRPVRVELDRWPRLNLTAPPGICPFGEAKVKVQNLYGARNQFHETNHIVSGAPVPAVPIHAAPDPVVEKEDGEEARLVQKPVAPQELVGVPIVTTGDAQRVLNFHFKKNLAINKQQGYCDCCGVKFHNIDEHVKGEEHRSFARQKCNYESLDVLISRIPSTVDFLQSVLLKHCVQRHVEPTVSSCPASQYVNLVPPISPLTTDKINVPSQETAATCIKTPDPSGQEIVTFREHFAATDTDLISKRGTVTPTKQEPVVDSRPQAVVIRRPMPSGMFTSPRRRPVTPSKKPWMQERSMVFSDSPIGSLQPSPCTSKETLPNFLCDSMANTLTRLATVCDKSSTGKPNHTSEGSKATKQLFSMILNQNFSTLRKKKSVTAQLGKKQTDFCQAKSGSVEQAKEINNSPLEVRMAAVDRENVELSHNDGDEVQGAEEDKTEQGFHPEKCFSVEHEAAVEHCQIQESMMIRSKSQVNDSCARKMTVKQKLEFGDIHNEVCSNSNKEVIISPHTNDLAVDKEKRIKDCDNKSLTTEEMECAASIHKTHVNLEQEREVIDFDQGIEVTAKQKRENVSSSHDTGSRHETGLSVEQEKECRAVIHEQIVIVEQEKVADCNQENMIVEQEKVADCNQENMIVEQENKVADCNQENMIVEQENKVVDCNQESTIVEQENKVADCNQEKDMTTKQKMEKLDFGHNTSMSIEQEQDSTGLSAEQEIEETAVIRENITVEEEKEVTVCSQEKDITAKLELEKFSRNASLSVEQEPKTTSLSVEQEIGCTAVVHEKIMTAEQEMECTAVMHKNITTVEQKVEHKAVIHENVTTGEQEIEHTADIHENITTAEQEVERAADIHETITTVEPEEEVTECSQEKDVTVRQELENFNHDASKSVEQEPEVTGCNEFVIFKQDMEKLGSGCDRTGTDEREMEVTVSGQGTVVAVEQRKEVIGFQHEHIVIDQEAMEVMGSSPDNDIAIEQEQEVTSFSHEKTVIIEKDREVMRFSHDNGETFEPAKGVINFSHDNSITAEQDREVANFSRDNSITAEQEREVTNFSHNNSITAEQEREVTNFSHNNSITAEQDMEMIGFSHDNGVTFEPAKGVTNFSHDNSITAEQEREVTNFSCDNSITVEQKEVIGFSHDSSVTVEQAKEVTSFSHDNSITVEQAKEVTSFSHDNSITVEQAKEVTSFSHDNSITVEQAKEVTSFSHDNSITVEQVKEVTSLSHDNSITVEQVKEVTSFSHDNSITVDQETEVLEPSSDDSVTIEGEGYYNDRVMTVGNVFCVPEINCWESMNVQEKEIRKKCTAVEQIMEQPSHKEIVTFEEEKIGSNFNKEKCKTFVGKEENKRNDRNHVEIITYEQAYRNNDKNLNIEQEMEEIISDQDKKSICVLFENEETDSAHDKVRSDEEEIKEKGTNHAKIATIDGKTEPSSNQMQMDDVEEGKAENNSNYEKMMAVEEKKEFISDQEQMENVEEGKESSLNHDKQVTVFEQDKVMMGYRNVFIEQKVVTNAIREKRKVVGQENEVMNFNLGKSVLTENLITVTKFHSDVNISDQEKCEAIENKKKKMSDLKRRLTDEQEIGVIGSSHEKMGALENKKEKVYNHEEDKSIDRRKERKQFKERGKSVEETATSGTTCKEEMTVDKRKERKRSNHEKHAAVEENKRHIDPKEDECMAVETNQVKTGSDHVKALIDDHRNNTKRLSHGESISIDEKKQTTISNCGKEKSVERRKKRKSSNHEKHLSVEEKKDKGSNHDENMDAEFKKEKTSFHHEKVLADEQRGQKKGSNNEEDKSVERRDERKSSNHRKSAPIEETVKKGSSCKADAAVEKRKERNRSNREKHAFAEETNKRNRSNHEKHSSTEETQERNRSNHEKHASAEEMKERNRSNHEKHASAEEMKERNSREKHASAEVIKERNRSNHEKHSSPEETKERNRSNHEKHASADEMKERNRSNHEKHASAEVIKERNRSNHEKHSSPEETKERNRSNHEKHASADEMKERNRSNHEKHASAEVIKERNRSNHEKHSSPEETKEKNRSNHEKHEYAEEMKERNRSNHEKHASAEEMKERNSHEKHASAEVIKERNRSNHEKHLSPETKERNRSNHEKHASAEVIKERNRSNHEKHSSPEETKEKIRSNHEKHASAEEMKERNRSNHEKHSSPEETKERNRSNHEKHACAEVIKERNRSNHEKHSSPEETKEKNRSNHEKHASAEKIKERNRSNHEKHASAEEMKERHSHEEHASAEVIKERNRSNHEKHSSPEETKERNRSSHEKHASSEEMKERNRTNHQKHVSDEEMKEKNRSDHLRHVSAEEMKEKNRSNHQKHASAEETKEKNRSNQEKNRSNHEKHVSTEEMESHVDSKHNERKAVENKMKKESSDHGKRLIYEPRTINNDSSHEKYVAIEEKKKIKVCDHVETCVQRKQDGQSSSHDNSLSVEKNKKKDFSPQDGKPVEKNDAQKRSRYEKYLAEEGKKKNKYSKHVSMVAEKDKKCSLHEKRLTDEQRSQQNGSKHEEDEAVEKQKKRKRSSHEKYASVEEIKNNMDFKYDESMDVENKNEKDSFHHERKFVDEPRDKDKCSNHEKKMAVEDEEKTKTKVSNHKEDKSVERNKDMKNINHEKHSAYKEKRSNNEHMAIENIEKKSSHCKKALIDDQRQQKNSKREDKSVEKRKEDQSSNHVEEKEMKSSTCEEYMAGKKGRKRQRSDYKKYQDGKHNAGMSVACKEKDSSHHEKQQSGEQGNRRKSSSCETNIAAKDTKEAKVSNRGEDRSVERRQERKPSKHERSLSLEGKEVRDSNCKEGLSVEKKRERKSSNHGKHLATEGKKSNEENTVVESKKEMKSRHEKELAGEQRIQPKGYNQQEDKRKDRKRSDETHAVAEEFKSHLKSKHHENLAVECGNEKEKSNHDKRLINESRNRRTSSSREKHTAVEENKKTKVSSHDKDKSVERNKDRQLSNHERSVSVEKREITASNCKEDIVTEKRKERQRSEHEKHEIVKEKKKIKGSESGESMAVDKITKKSSDQEKSSKAEQEKNIKDFDNNKSSDIRKETAHRDMNPVVRICGRELGQCIVSDSLAETVYKHLAGRSLSTGASNLIYVASHKVSINNLLLKGGQIPGQTSQGIDSSSAHASADTAYKSVLESKSGQSCPHKHEDRSGQKTGCKVCKDVDGVCVDKAVKSTTESKSTNVDKMVNADVGLSEETDRMTCDNAIGHPGKLNRKSSSKEKPGKCKTKTRKSYRKEGSDLHGDLQEHLEKQGKPFKADKKAGNAEKYVETDRQLGFQGTGWVIGEVGEVNSRQSNAEFQIPSMKQSSEVVKSVSKPAEKLNEVVCNSKDSYMDEDTVDIDFYESYNLGRQSNIVNIDGLNDVHTSFPYISDRAALPHSSESTTFPITTQPIPPHTRQSKTENVVRTCDSSPSDCKLTHDQNVQQPRSSTDADKHVRDKEGDTDTEYGTNCSYKNSVSRSSRRNKQIYSDGRLQLSIQQRNVSKGKCVQEENISTDKEMMGQLSGDKFSEESARGMHAVSDEVSTSTITSSSVVVPEQSEHPLRTGSLFEEDDDTDSLLSSENMKTVKRNSDDSGDFIELMGQFGSVVVPNIAERVKSRSRLACGAPSSAVDKGVQRSDEEKKARKRRKKELREKHRQNLLDGINSQQVEQLSDTSGKSAARNVMSNSGDKRCKNTRTRKSTPAPIVPNIAESVKNRRSCTMFNHLGQYADSGEGSDAEDENIQVKPRSAEKCRQRKYSSRERNLKALSSNSGTEYDKNGLVKHSRVLYCQRKSNDVKVNSSVDFLPEMEIDSKTSSLSGCPSKAEDEPNDLSSAVVVRRKKSNVYPSNKRPEVDWGKVQPSDGSSEPDPVENSLLRGTLIAAERNKTHAQSDLILKSSHHGWSHSTTGSQASPTELIREAKVVLVDINTSPNANIHTKATSGHHFNIHGGTPTSPYHANVQIKTSSSPYAKIHTNSPTIHYPTDIHIKTSTSPYHAKFHTQSPTIHYPTDIHVKTSISPYHTNINIETPTRHYRTDSGDPVMHRSRHRKAKQAETSGQPLCSKFPHSVRNMSDVPSSPGISCSPRLRLKIRRRSGNKGFSSTLEEIHDCLPANLIGCSSHVDTEHCSESCECPNRFEDKYSSRIDNLSTEPLTKQDIGRSSSDLLPQAQYGELSQSVSDVIKSSKRTREPSASYSSDSESTLEYPLSFEAVNKRIKLSPGHCSNPDVCDNYNADNQRNEVSPYITALDTSANTSLPRDPISSNRFRSSSPCFSSPVTKSHFKCFTTPKKYDAADRPAAGSESPVFNLSMKQLRHAQSSHSSASAHGLSGDSHPQTGMTYLALQNAGLQASVILDSSMTMKRTPGRHLSSKRSLSPPDLNLPSAKKTKVEASRRASADRHSIQLASKQETIPLESFAESSNHGFHSLFQAAPKFNPAADYNHTVNHVLPSHSASMSQHGQTSVPPYAEAPHLDLKSFDGTEWVTCTTTDRNMKPASPRESDEDTVMLLEIDRFSGVSDLGFEDLLSQVHTFSSPEKATDTSWGDICDTYLSTSFNNHHAHNVGQPGLGQSPAGRGAKVVSFSPCRKQFKNCSSPLRKGPPEESVKGQTGSSHIIKQKTTMGPERKMSKNQANCSGVDTAVEQELRTPVKNADIEDLKCSPYIQTVDEVISFNFMSPQRIKFSPHQTCSSSTKLPLSPQTEHRRSQNASHSRRLFSPAKISPQRVNSSPCHVHKSTLQSLLSPQAEHQKSNTASHSRRFFSPHSPQSVYVSPHRAHRSTLQSQLSPQAEHRRPHTASHSKRLFSPHSPQSAYCSPHHRSTLQSLLNPQAEQQRPHTTSHSKRLFSPAKKIAADEVS